VVPRCSLPYSQQPDTYSYPEQVQALPASLFNIHFSMVLPSMPRSCAQITVHFPLRCDVWTCWLRLGHWFLTFDLVSTFSDTNLYLNSSMMEKLEFLPTDRDTASTECGLWTVNWSRCAPVRLHKGRREQLNLGVTEQGPAQRRAVNTREIFAQRNQIEVSKIKVTGGFISWTFVCYWAYLKMGRS